MQFIRKPRLILSLVVFLLVSYLLWRARGALAPFAVALVVGYILLPAVHFLEDHIPSALRERGIARPVAIFGVYAIVLFAVYLFGRALLEPLVGQLVAFINNLPRLTDDIVAFVSSALEEYRDLLSPEWQAQIEQQLASYNPSNLVNLGMGALRGAFGAATSFVGFLFGLLILPFWLFFILNDEGKVIRGLLNIVPHEWRADVEAVRIIIDQVLGSYLRGQLAVATILGLMITIGLTVIKVQYSLLLGVAAAIFALIPLLGAFLGAFPAIIVAFFQSPEKALFTVALFVVVQQIDNIFISPKIIGEAVALHPALIILVLLIGGTLFGAPGALIAVPVTAMLRDIVSYLYFRADEDQQIEPTDALNRVGYEEGITDRMLRYERQRALPLAKPRRIVGSIARDNDKG